jgi:hypothetical protein
VKTFGYEYDRHIGVARQNLMQPRINCSQVIDDYESGVEIRRKMLEEANVSIEPTSRPTNTYHWKVVSAFPALS